MQIESPCEAMISPEMPCPRPATTDYRGAYYCKEHAAVLKAIDDYDEILRAVHHAERFQTMAFEEGNWLLERCMSVALSGLKPKREAAERALAAARRRADTPT